MQKGTRWKLFNNVTRHHSFGWMISAAVAVDSKTSVLSNIKQQKHNTKKNNKTLKFLHKTDFFYHLCHPTQPRSPVFVLKTRHDCTTIDAFFCRLQYLSQRSHRVLEVTKTVICMSHPFGHDTIQNKIILYFLMILRHRSRPWYENFQTGSREFRSHWDCLKIIQL